MKKLFVAVTFALLLAPLTTQPWHLYLTIGVMVGAGSVCLGYSGQSLFLPNWFIRRRGLAIGLAFAGVGVASVIASRIRGSARASNPPPPVAPTRRSSTTSWPPPSHGS